MWIIFFMGLGVVVMAVLVFSVLTIMKKEGEVQEAEAAMKRPPPTDGRAVQRHHHGPCPSRGPHFSETKGLRHD